MPIRRRLAVCLVASSLALPTLAQTVSTGPSIPETTSAINSPTPLSQRVVAYDIDAKYDAKAHSLDATETLTYHNLTGQSLDTFPFHLYLNGFQPKSTWVREAKLSGSRDTSFEKWESNDYGADEIKSFEVVGKGDFTSRLQYIHPDDDNQDDRTVFQVHLDQPISPGGFVQFKIRFHDQFPRTVARTGWDGDFLLAGQWFPKIGVWWHGAWNCHQFHAETEFFADFGVYDVRLTAPQSEVVGASGVEVGSVNNRDGTKTVTYHGDDIHDFAWTVSPRYKVFNDTFQSSMGPVKLRFLMQPAHWNQVDRHDRILKATMDRFERWYGPYPYKTLTLVDPYPDSAASGMEYPTFITGGTPWLALKGSLDEPEETVVHEFGHQYWYGMVATNEFEDPWLDEGIDMYSQFKVMDSLYGPETSFLNLWGMTAGQREFRRLGYLRVADLDPITRKGWQYASEHSYVGIVYDKTPTVLLTLESIIGEDTLGQAMRTYFMRYRFTHPGGEDFLKTIEEVSGKDLRWYFDQTIYGTQVLDDEVVNISSIPMNWYKENPGEKKGEEFTSAVWIHNKGEFILPVDIEIKFDNGEKVRERWNGRDRWIKYSYQKMAKIESVEVDPDHKIAFDRNNFNNSRTAKPNGAAASKLANYWIFLAQFFAQFLAWWMV